MRQSYPILWLAYETQHLLAASFLRFQEHYESPKFRGQVFSWEEYMDWYARENGEFTYLTDWSGFNLPDTAFDSFLRGEFNPLTRKEFFLLDVVRDHPRPFYVIGTVRDDDSAISHELIHGLYYLEPMYRAAVDEVLKQNALEAMRDHLMRLSGYCEQVLNDEINAYLVSQYNMGVTFDPEGVVTLELRHVFQKFFGRNVWQSRGMQSILHRCQRIDVYINRAEDE